MSCEHTQEIPEGLSLITGCGCAVTWISCGEIIYSLEALITHFKEHTQKAKDDTAAVKHILECIAPNLDESVDIEVSPGVSIFFSDEELG